MISVLTVLCTVLSLLVGILTFNRSRDKDVKNDASESAVIKTKLDTISRGVENIQIEIKANEKRVSELAEKVIRIEESNKALHERVNKIEEKGDA